MSHILSWMTFTPLIGALVIAFLPKTADKAIRLSAAVFTGIPLLLSFVMLQNYDASNAGLQFVERAGWISSLNVEYAMGIDGISVLMVLLTAIISFLAVFASHSIKKMVKGYFMMLMLLHVVILS